MIELDENIKQLLDPYYSLITTQAHNLTQSTGAARPTLEERQLDAQVFLWIFPELGDQRTHVCGQSRQVVLELRIGKQFARCIVILV